ncbi:hypothetical protein [Kribbella sp. NBC_00359]|uniref:hypothetical protein n=1 Tax=Kribbella sp. NBC_00359 TaxID=2975966 RepID=UPI002E1EE5C0
MASQRKLPEDWLNTQAGPWMPPLPEGALQRRDPPGLHITYATDEFLLATKLVAQRRKDAADIVALAGRLQMENASADDLEQLIHRYYTDEDSLEFILDGNDLDREIRLLAVRAERLLAKHHPESTREIPLEGTKHPAKRPQNRATSRERS